MLELDTGCYNKLTISLGKFLFFCGMAMRGAMATGLSLLATHRTFHFGLKHAALSLADAST
jgi:hypothetical protein